MTVANSSTVVSGHGGKVLVADYDATPFTVQAYILARVTEWSFNPTTTTSQWADSDSQGYTNTLGGRRAGSGTISGVLDKNSLQYNNLLFNIDTDEPENNDVVQLALWHDGHESAPSTFWYLPRAVVSNFQMTFDVDNRSEVRWSANFDADGKYYKPGETNAPSLTYSNYSVGAPGVNA